MRRPRLTASCRRTGASCCTSRTRAAATRSTCGPFPGPGGKWQVSTTGGGEPYWSGDGGRIFYRSDRRLYYVDVDTSNGFRARQPVAFADIGVRYAREVSAYSVHPDGDRVLVADSADPDSRPTEVRIVTNWFDRLSTLAPR